MERQKELLETCRKCRGRVVAVGDELACASCGVVARSVEEEKNPIQTHPASSLPSGRNFPQSCCQTIRPLNVGPSSEGMGTGKKRHRKLETPYAHITEIREIATTDEANKCLNTGFVLIRAVEKRESDPLGRQATSIVYVLGRPKGDGTQTRVKNGPPSESVNIMDDTPHIDPSILEGRPWKAYAKGEGEWTFVVNKDGSPMAELEQAREFLDRLKNGEDLVVGRYKYRLRDKFLKRYAADGPSN